MFSGMWLCPWVSVSAPVLKNRVVFHLGVFGFGWLEALVRDHSAAGGRRSNLPGEGTQHLPDCHVVPILSGLLAKTDGIRQMQTEPYNFKGKVNLKGILNPSHSPFFKGRGLIRAILFGTLNKGKPEGALASSETIIPPFFKKGRGSGGWVYQYFI